MILTMKNNLLDVLESIDVERNSYDVIRERIDFAFDHIQNSTMSGVEIISYIVRALRYNNKNIGSGNSSEVMHDFGILLRECNRRQTLLLSKYSPNYMNDLIGNIVLLISFKDFDVEVPGIKEYMHISLNMMDKSNIMGLVKGFAKFYSMNERDIVHRTNSSTHAARHLMSRTLGDDIVDILECYAEAEQDHSAMVLLIYVKHVIRHDKDIVLLNYVTRVCGSMEEHDHRFVDFACDLMEMKLGDRYRSIVNDITKIVARRAREF